MEAQLPQVIDWLPFLRLLGCNQQVGDFWKARRENILGDFPTVTAFTPLSQ